MISILVLVFPKTNPFLVNAKAAPAVITSKILDVHGHEYSVDCVLYDYDNNLYLSLRDVASAMRDTDCCFDILLSSDKVIIKKGEKYTPYDEEKYPWSEEYCKELKSSRKTNNMEIDGREVKYYSIILKGEDGVYDCFMSIIDLSMILDAKIDMEDNDRIVFDELSDGGYNGLEMEEFGIFEGVNAVLIGDATDGDVFYGYNADESFPIASTTKLMTYLLTMEAISEGKISLDSIGMVSKKGQLLAESADGVLPLAEGMELPVRELIYGAMVASSNECALTLAETVSGSEEDFVVQMNEKAAELKLEDTIFYNCHGLPVYTKEPYPGKISNHMTARDMFKMCSYILSVYPQITDVTSLKSVTLNSLEKEIKTTNSLLYNIPEVTGLKTGTTNKAGCCLITSLRVDNHDLLVVLFGAETGFDRTQISELLCRYAIKVEKGIISEKEENRLLPDDSLSAEDMIKKLINSCRQ